MTPSRRRSRGIWPLATSAPTIRRALAPSSTRCVGARASSRHGRARPRRSCNRSEAMGRAARRRFALVAAALAVVASVSAHQNTALQPDAELAALLTTAKRSFNDRDWDRGTAGYQALVAAARAKGAVVWEGRGTLGLGEIAYATARYDDARRYSLEALAMFEPAGATNDIGDANMMLAAIADTQGDGRTAAPYYERAVTAYRAAGNERAGIEASLGLLGVTTTDTSPLDGYGELQVGAQAIGDKALEGQILHDWGDWLSQRSLYQPAVEKLDAAAALFQAINSLANLGTTYNSLGRLYRQHGQPAAALEFQLKALRIHETINTPRLLIQSLNAVAVASQMSGDNGQARVYYERGLAAAERTGFESYINFMRANLGGFLMVTDSDVDRGRDLIERAVAAGAGPASLRQTQLSDAYLKLGRRQEALAAAGRALTSCRTPIDCVYARVSEGRAQLALGNEAAALADLNEILAAVEQMHSTLAASDFLKQNFQRLWEDAYSIAIDLHFRRGEYREALEASEMARSRAFVDLLASRQLERSGDAMPTLTMRGATASAAAPPAVAASPR